MSLGEVLGKNSLNFAELSALPIGRPGGRGRMDQFAAVKIPLHPGQVVGYVFAGAFPGERKVISSSPHRHLTEPLTSGGQFKRRCYLRDSLREGFWRRW